MVSALLDTLAEKPPRQIRATYSTVGLTKAVEKRSRSWVCTLVGRPGSRVCCLPGQ